VSHRWLSPLWPLLAASASPRQHGANSKVCDATNHQLARGLVDTCRSSTMLRVVVMNDHAASLGAWLSVLALHDPPATVLHIDRHSDLAGPSQCDARATPRGDRATWARCADRAGFQQAAAWLGLVHRVWWLKPGGWSGVSEWREGVVKRSRSLRRLELQHAISPAAAATEASDGGDVWQPLAVRIGGLAELGALRAADVAGPLLLDIDLDYWGGAAGPQRPAWEAPGRYLQPTISRKPLTTNHPPLTHIAYYCTTRRRASRRAGRTCAPAAPRPGVTHAAPPMRSGRRCSVR